MTWEDTAGMPHIVICKGESDLKVIEFTGEKARDQAHEKAQELTESFDGCIIIAVRVRQLCNSKNFHLMT